MLTKHITSIVFAAVLVSSCGGGGGGGGGVTPADSTPTVSFSADVDVAKRGDTVTLSWSSENTQSCSASRSWTSDIGTSGSRTLVFEEAGEYEFIITCSNVSQTVMVSVAEVYDAELFARDDQLFSGYIFHKRDDYAGCLSSIQAEIGLEDSSNLFFKSFVVSEQRYLGYFDGSNELSLGDNLISDEPLGVSINSASPSATNLITIASSLVDPYNFTDADSIEYLEQFSADVSLDLEIDENNMCGADLSMTVLAFPPEQGKNNAIFFGTSQTSNSYTFLYLIDDREVEANNTNLPSESDIFNIEYGVLNSYHSYQSQPNIEIVEAILVSSDVLNFVNVGQQNITGSRSATSVSPEEDTSPEAVKYLYPIDDSNQRIYLKVSPNTFCFGIGSAVCQLLDPEILFFMPDGSELLGFALGGYNGKPNTTYTTRWVPYD